MKEKLTEKFYTIIKNQRESLLEWFRKSDNDKAQLCLCTENFIPTKNDITVLKDLDTTLQRIENNDYGKCSICNDEIEKQLLELDFTKEVCLDHYNEYEKRLLERDLEMAAKVQRQLLPYELPNLNGYQISVHSESAGIVGGDYFDFYCNMENKQGIVIGDVMGKGLQASLLMANIQASLRILGPEFQETDKLAFRINELFKFNSKLISFVSLFLSKLDTKNNTLLYTNAGHNPPIFYKAAEGKIELLKPNGPAIGLSSNPIFKMETISFDEGDILAFYTDGLTESRNENNEEFQVDRLISIIKTNHNQRSEDILSTILKEVKHFSNDLSKDDTTLIILKKN